MSSDSPDQADEDTVERVARAIRDADYNAPDLGSALYRTLARAAIDALTSAPGTDTPDQAVQRVLALADDLDSHVKPRSFHPAGTHSDGASHAYADAAARIRAAVAGPQRDHDEDRRGLSPQALADIDAADDDD